MITLRKHTPRDVPALMKLYPDLDEAAAQALVEEWNAEQYRGNPFLMLAVTEDNELIGYVISVITKEGYGGDIRMYMGVTMSGRLMGISILEIHETPGLGMRASEVLVPQFRDLKGTEFTVTKNGKVAENEIDAITSATITSKAVTRGVNFGLKYFDELTKGGADE